MGSDHLEGKPHKGESPPDDLGQDQVLEVGHMIGPIVAATSSVTVCG